jgi:hypothetical protein
MNTIVIKAKAKCFISFALNQEKSAGFFKRPIALLHSGQEKLINIDVTMTANILLR